MCLTKFLLSEIGEEIGKTKMQNFNLKEIEENHYANLLKR